MGKKQPSEQTPVYAVVHASLRTQIFTGQYRPGDLLPSESHLCQEFGASRETVRRGLQQLENEGLIFSRPKIGYFVSQPNHNDMVLSLSEELEGTELQYRDIHGILPDERLQELLDIPANRKVIEFSQISRDGEGQPVAYDVKFVPYARAYPSVESEIRYAVLPDLTFAKLSSFSVYSQITVTAVAAEGEPARALECPEGTPLLLRPDVQELLRDVEQGRFQVLVVASAEVLQCPEGEWESLLAVLQKGRVRTFAAQRGCWLEPGGRRWPPLPRPDWTRLHKSACPAAVSP